jgi:hypothetical protein
MTSVKISRHKHTRLGEIYIIIIVISIMATKPRGLSKHTDLEISNTISRLMTKLNSN